VDIGWVNNMLKDIYKIAAFGTVSELKDALEDQGDPNSFSDKSGLTALAKVSKNGQLDKVKALVLNGAIHDQEMSLFQMSRNTLSHRVCNRA